MWPAWEFVTESGERRAPAVAGEPLLRPLNRGQRGGRECNALSRPNRAGLSPPK